MPLCARVFGAIVHLKQEFGAREERKEKNQPAALIPAPALHEHAGFLLARAGKHLKASMFVFSSCPHTHTHTQILFTTRLSSRG